jgi:hypothetical protein
MYVEYHEHFSNEVYQATACYVIWKNLQNEPAKDKDLLRAFNTTPLSWVCIRHSMMVSLIMSLGRIFDTDGDAVSIDDLIKSCITDIQVFSKNSLQQRKLQNHGAEEWIASYMENAYEPTSSDFNRLKPDIKKFREIYEKFYRPIRHKIFAHSDKQYQSKTDDLWQATAAANIEDVLNFLEDFNLTIKATYLNGRKPELKGRKIDEEQFSKDIKLLLSKVKQA